MKLFGIILAVAATVATVRAECPNACSGHGTCGVKDACSCYSNWMGGDCSQRVCPFGLAFVDTPLGDLNHDGNVENGDSPLTQTSNAAVDEMWQGSTSDEGHFYAECSGKGACDRATGMCSCFDGFTGSSCQRTTCPNDCSGHGQCYTLRSIAAGPNVPKVHASTRVGRNFRLEDYQYGVYSLSGVSEAFDYDLWDADKNQACVCDSGFFGPDCSLRDCPRGNDPLTNDIRHCGGSACTSEVQEILVNLGPGDTTAAGSVKSTTMYLEWADGEDYSALLNPLRSADFTVRPGLTGDEYAELFQDALESFPNGVLNGVTVSCEGAYVNGAYLAAHSKCYTAINDNTGVAEVSLKVDFTNGPQGDVAALTPYFVSQDGSTTVTRSGAVMGVLVNAKEGFQIPAIAPSSTKLGGAISDGGSTYNAAEDPNASGTPVVTTANGNQENSPCSNRGVCDYTSGQCKCFAGYIREDCSVQSALSM